jgi:hypothetical protein
MESWPSVVWDVNGYYYDLGVGFRADRRQLLRAYTARDGQSNPRLTYVFAQLLKPDVRRAYDSAPLGSIYIDQYVIESAKRAAHEQSKKFQQMGRNVTPEQIMREWGFQIEDLPGDDENLPVEVEEDLDITKDSREAESSPAEDDGAWPYTYFVWKLQRREDRPAENAVIMRRWQEAIVEECQRREVAVNFGVGLMGGKQDQRFTTMSVRGVTVAFLSVIHADRIEEIAPLAVQRLTTVRV